jgi:PAS domain-containing protein
VSEKRVEVILTRMLAGYLATPILVVDAQGTLLFFNEPAEALLGRRFEETGEVPATAWHTILSATDCRGVPLGEQQLPLITALTTRRPAYAKFWIRRSGVEPRHVEAMALPLIGMEDRDLGAVVILWER